MLVVTEFGLGHLTIFSGLMFVSRLFCGDSLTKFVFKIVKIVIRTTDKAIKKN